jgi:hypothetical protein
MPAAANDDPNAPLVPPATMKENHWWRLFLSMMSLGAAALEGNSDVGVPAMVEEGETIMEENKNRVIRAYRAARGQ